MSSMQVDTRERGFSYAYDAPLDMRMDPEQELTAREVVNTWERRRLARALREYGEERYADRIAGHIVRAAPAGDHLRARRRDHGRHPRARALRRRAPGQAHLPGDPDRRQRGARPARRGAAARLAGPAPRRPPGRDLVPLARGPARQALPRRSHARLHLPAGPAGVRLRAHARGRARVPPLRRARPPARSRPTPARSPRGCGLPASSRRSQTDAPDHRPAAARPDHAPARPPPRPPPRQRPDRPPDPALSRGGGYARPSAAPPASSSASARSPSSRVVDRAAARPRVDLGDRDHARRDRRHAGLAAQAQRRDLHAASSRRARSSASTPTSRRRSRGCPPASGSSSRGDRGGDGRAAGRRRRVPELAPGHRSAAGRSSACRRPATRRASVMANGGRALAPRSRRAPPSPIVPETTATTPAPARHRGRDRRRPSPPRRPRRSSTPVPDATGGRTGRGRHRRDHGADRLT